MANSGWQSFSKNDTFEVQMDPVGPGNYDSRSYLPSNQGIPQNSQVGSEFEFHTSTDTGQSVSGIIEPNVPKEEPQASPRLRQRGKTAKFLESKGFAWLLEEEVDDDDFQKPLLEELDIDMKDIYYKLRCVLLPIQKSGLNHAIVRDSPDFWGPLAVVLLYSLVSMIGQFRVVSWIMTIWIFGSVLIFLLARVLGGEVTYSQCVGVIGYCLLPLVIIGLFLPLVKSVFVISFVFKAFAVFWASYSAGSLLCGQELRHKRPLLLYPIFLLNIYFLSLYTGV